jgi:aryl-alcohol dehydrogenase-like predicted oxidoreductase
MQYVNLGASGLRVSRVCLGMMSFGDDSERPWVLDEAAAEPIVRAAADGGVTFFDTADTYSHGASEIATGHLLGKLFTREEVVVATKVFMPMTPGENGGGLSHKHVLSAIDASLERLGMIPLCVDQGVGVIPWSPLARGVLTGSRTREGERLTKRADSDQFTDYLYAQPTDFDVVERVAEVAGQRGVAPAQVALAWLLHRPGVTAPIFGATKLGHVQDALAAEQLELTDQELARLEEPYVPHPVLGHG